MGPREAASRIKRSPSPRPSPSGEGGELAARRVAPFFCQLSPGPSSEPGPDRARAGARVHGDALRALPGGGDAGRREGVLGHHAALAEAQSGEDCQVVSGQWSVVSWQNRTEADRNGCAPPGRVWWGWDTLQKSKRLAQGVAREPGGDLEARADCQAAAVCYFLTIIGM